MSDRLLLNSASAKTFHYRSSLVRLLSSVAADSRRDSARRFLEGLSGDELRYIVEYFGARLLDPALAPAIDRNGAARGVEQFQRAISSSALAGGGDPAHKMILLLEFLTLTEARSSAKILRAAAGSA